MNPQLCSIESNLSWNNLYRMQQVRAKQSTKACINISQSLIDEMFSSIFLISHRFNMRDLNVLNCVLAIYIMSGTVHRYKVHQEMTVLCVPYESLLLRGILWNIILIKSKKNWLWSKRKKQHERKQNQVTTAWHYKRAERVSSKTQKYRAIPILEKRKNMETSRLWPIQLSSILTWEAYCLEIHYDVLHGCVDVG